MTDTLETNGDGGEVLDPNIRAQLKRTRELESDAAEAMGRAVAAERRAVFAEVGVPVEGVGKLFRDAYSGDLDPGAVLAAATDYGILGGTPVTDDNSITDAEREAQRRMAGGSSGGVPPAGQSGYAAYTARIEQANSKEEVMAVIREMESAHPELGRFTSED